MPGPEIEVRTRVHDESSIEIDVADIRLVASVGSDGMVLSGEALRRSVRFAGQRPDSLRAAVDVLDEDAVAHFSQPLTVPGRATVRVWLGWPLRVRLANQDGEPLLELRPGFQRSFFGPVDEGRVFPAARCAFLRSVDDEGLRGCARAALAVRLENHTNDAVTVSRIPVEGEVLELYRKGDTFATGEVHVKLHADAKAEGRTLAGHPPDGFGKLRASPRRARGTKREWGIDSTRRSVEFTL